MVTAASVTALLSVQQGDSWIAWLQKWQGGLGAVIGLSGLGFVEALRRQAEERYQRRTERQLAYAIGETVNTIKVRAVGVRKAVENHLLGSPPPVTLKKHQYENLRLDSFADVPFDISNLSLCAPQLAAAATQFQYALIRLQRTVEVRLNPALGGVLDNANKELIDLEVSQVELQSKAVSDAVDRICGPPNHTPQNAFLPVKLQAFSCTWTGRCPFNRA